jgi:hypothetical protein
MRRLNRTLLSTSCLAFALGVSANAIAQEQPPSEAKSQPVAEGSALSATSAGAMDQTSLGREPLSAVAELPDSPGTEWAQAQSTSAQQSGSSQTSTPATSQGNASDDQKLQRPVGTAAAEAPKVSGVTAAQPAGVAIAPAKQRRVRTIVLKVGAILGAGAALGAVIALTAATPSKPPGAH